MKIIYGVAGEGMGHALRSSVIIDHLIKQGHDVHVISSGRAVKFLKRKYKKVTKITGLVIKYDGNKVNKIGTVLANAKSTKKVLKNIDLIAKLFKKFKPNLVVTDFEGASYVFAKKNKIPVLAIDNIQSISRCKIDKALKGINFNIAKTIVDVRCPKCDKYLVSSFFDAPVKKKYESNTKVHYPVIRDIVKGVYRTSDARHVVVYQTSDSNTNLIKELKKVRGYVFLVYGFRRDIKDVELDGSNVIHKPFSEHAFVADLASSCAVISGGSFTVMTECLYLRKPLMSIPVEGQFEQEMNAHYLEKMGYGKRCKNVSVDSVGEFLENIAFYNDNLKDYEHDGNKALFEDIDEFVKNIGK